jgi:hypothetical protein
MGNHERKRPCYATTRATTAADESEQNLWNARDLRYTQGLFSQRYLPAAARAWVDGLKANKAIFNSKTGKFEEQMCQITRSAANARKRFGTTSLAGRSNEPCRSAAVTKNSARFWTSSSNRPRLCVCSVQKSSRRSRTLYNLPQKVRSRRQPTRANPNQTQNKKRVDDFALPAALSASFFFFKDHASPLPR